MKAVFVSVAALLGAYSLIAAPQEKESLPKPVKQHELLKLFEGDWDVRTKCMQPGKEQEGQGTETNRVTMGGFWVTFDHKGTFGGEPYEGRGFMGFDPQKARFVGVWVDSVSPYLCSIEGDADVLGRRFSFKMSGTNPQTGKPMAGRLIFDVIDKDHQTHRFYETDESGKEKLLSEMTYTRKTSDAK